MPYPVYLFTDWKLKENLLHFTHISQIPVCTTSLWSSNNTGAFSSNVLYVVSSFQLTIFVKADSFVYVM